MSKIMVYILLVVVSVVFCTSDSMAFWGKKKKTAPEVTEQKQPEQKQPETEEPIKVEKKAEEKKPEKTEVVSPPKPVDKKALDQARILRQKKQDQLNDSAWDVEVNLLGGESKKESDVLNFAENQFSSKSYTKEGFNPTNYTLTIQEDGTTVWETMQTSDKGKVIFWRGEIVPEMTSMRGVFSWRDQDGNTKDYSFVSTNKRPLVKEE